jgi:small nuclear ribonucleoprotein (snRNP)-like protein
MERKLGLAVTTVALTMLSASAGAQMVVHAVSGVLKAVDPHANTMQLTVDNGDTSQFKLPSGAKVTLDFDKALQSDSVNADKFQHVGEYVVVYYYGYDDNRTAVAVKDLGTGPFEKIDGTVASYDKHARTMTVKDDAGKSESFALGDHLVVDTGVSVAGGRGYDPHKGWQVRVTYTKTADKNTAVFVRSRQ